MGTRIRRTESKRPDSRRRQKQSWEHCGKAGFGLRQSVRLLGGFSFHDQVGDEEVEDSANDAADETADVDEAGVVSPEIGRHGEELRTDGGNGHEAAEEAAVAGSGNISENSCGFWGEEFPELTAT